MIELIVGIAFGAFFVHVIMNGKRRKHLYNALDIKGLKETASQPDEH